jgi:hypothetical protein
VELMSKSVHRRHRAGRGFQPNPYDPEKARRSIRDAIERMERDELDDRLQVEADHAAEMHDIAREEQ